MKIENQVCPLDLSKRLKELGFKQESLFYWVGNEEDKMFLSQETKDYRGFPDLSEDPYQFCYSAYTVAELGEMLPREFRSGSMEKGSNYYCRFEYMFKYGDIEADVRAKMLICLKENNLI